MEIQDPVLCEDARGVRSVWGIGPRGTLMWRREVGDRGAWTAWSDTMIPTGALAIGRSVTGDLRVFIAGRDRDRAVHILVPGDDGTIVQQLPLGGAAKSLKVAYGKDGALILCAIGMDDAVWYTGASSPSATRFWPWISLHGIVLQIAVERDARGLVHIFGIGKDNALWLVQEKEPGGAWLPWRTLGGWVSSITCGDSRDGKIEVFAIGKDASVWRIEQDGAGGFVPWKTHGGWVKQLAVASAAGGRNQIFGIGKDEAMWVISQVAVNGVYGSWERLNGKVKSLAAFSDAMDRMVLLAIAWDGALVSTSQPDPRRDGWSRWERFPANLPLQPLKEPLHMGNLAAGVTLSGTANTAAQVVPGQAFATLTNGTLFAQDFRIIRTLGQGGMGAVFVAEQNSLARTRALKVMLPELLVDEAQRAQFADEARIPSRIESDNVVDTVAAGIDTATSIPWIAMELLAGENLEARVERAGPMTHREARELFDQLGHALGAAHAAGVVHRDLKPANIFLSVPRRKGTPFTVKVLDFGLARAIATRHDGTDAKASGAAGSPFWMAPEQAQPQTTFQCSTDVWPLGLIAFYLLTGRDYWLTAATEGVTLQDVLQEMFVQPLPPASERAAVLQVGAMLPAHFDTWFARCVDRDRTKRFAHGGQACEALCALLV